MIRLIEPDGEGAKVTRPVSQSIINESTILHDGKNWTLVPKNAVVFLPKAMKSRVNTSPVGTLLPWSAFLKKNHDWVTTNEVTFEQAAGSEEISAKTTAAWSKENKIVVAVHHDGPISVRLADSPKALSMR